MSYLTPGLKYIVQFVMLMNDDAYSGTPVSLELVLLDGTKKSRAVDLMDLGKIKHVNVKVANFISTVQKGNVEFSLPNYDEEIKSGTKIAGVLIQPRF